MVLLFGARSAAILGPDAGDTPAQQRLARMLSADITDAAVAGLLGLIGIVVPFGLVLSAVERGDWIGVYLAHLTLVGISTIIVLPVTAIAGWRKKTTLGTYWNGLRVNTVDSLPLGLGAMFWRQFLFSVWAWLNLALLFLPWLVVRRLLSVTGVRDDFQMPYDQWSGTHLASDDSVSVSMSDSDKGPKTPSDRLSRRAVVGGVLVASTALLTLAIRWGLDRFWGETVGPSSRLGSDDLIVNPSSDVVHHAVACKNHFDAITTKESLGNLSVSDVRLHTGYQHYILELLADEAVEDGDFDTAIARLNAAIEARPFAYHLYDRLIKILGRLRRYDDIDQLLGNALQMVSNDRPTKEFRRAKAEFESRLSYSEERKSRRIGRLA